MSTTDTRQKDLLEKETVKKSGRFYNQKRGDFNIGTYEYPEDLRTREDLKHYIVFYINVRENSDLKFEETKKNVGVQDSPIQKDRKYALATEDVQEAKDIVVNNLGFLGGIAGFLSGKGLGSRLAAALGGAGAGELTKLAIQNLEKGTAGFKPAKSVRLKEVITLHIEESPSVRYGVNYTETDMGTLTGLLIQGSAAETGTMTDFAKEAGSRLIAEMFRLPNLGSQRGTLSDLRNLGTRSKTNPFREVLFESVDYRTFTFRYRFFPKSENESDRIKNILDLFKKHMHPELSSQKLFYIYPSEFEISYYYQGKENEYLHKFAPCVLQNMDVQYGGDQFATFDNGAPVEITAALTFREVEQVTYEGVSKDGL